MKQFNFLKTPAALILLGFITAPFHTTECRMLIKAKPGIVDGAGYSLSNSAFSPDLVLQANAGSSEDSSSLGEVTLEPSDNSPSQKWGVAFYGSSTASFTSGANRNNFVSVYFPTPSSSSRDRQYSFESDDGNDTFRMRNKETGLCLRAIKQESSESIIVDFGDCDLENQGTFWIFQRNG